MEIYTDNIKSIWESNQLQLDIPLIDLHHLWLIAIISNIDEILKSSNINPSDVSDSFEEASKFISEHFSLEEELIQTFNYPDLENHIEEHRKFIEKNVSKLTGFNPNQKISNSESLLFLSKLLSNWLFNHIKVEDKKYKNYLISVNADIQSFTQKIIDRGTLNISNLQASLYQSITNKSDVRENFNVNLTHTIRQIWNSYNLSLKMPILDIQHMWLIKMLVELETAIRTQGGTKRKEIFNQVIKEAINYAQEHFTTEESIMTQFSYTESDSHIFQHKQFIEFIKKRYEESKSNDLNATVQLARDLKEWLFSHIALEDRRLKEFLMPHILQSFNLVKKMQKEGKIHLNSKQLNLYKEIVGTNIGV